MTLAKKNKPALTPWFPGDVKPVHVGEYQCRIQGMTAEYLWDGKQWRTAIGPSVFQNAKWRGLAVKPE